MSENEFKNRYLPHEKLTEEYQTIQNKFEAWLKRYWQGIPTQHKRPDFKAVAIQYADCRRKLDQEFSLPACMAANPG